MKIPFICVNYNSEEETKKYIINVLQLEKAEVAIIIIVDNSPTDESFLKLKLFVEKNNFEENQVVILKKENKGYFQGLNEGILYALEIGCKNSFIVGNNDIIFENSFIVKLLNIYIDEKTLVIAEDVISTEGSHENPHVINKIGFLRKLKYDVYYLHYGLAWCLAKIKSTDRKYKSYDPIRKEIHMGIGALYVLTSNFFNYFETLSEEVFLYGEEAVLAGQINSVNGKIVYEPDLVCYHNESATTSKLDSKIKYEIVRKSYKIYRKYL